MTTHWPLLPLDGGNVGDQILEDIDPAQEYVLISVGLQFIQIGKLWEISPMFDVERKKHIIDQDFFWIKRMKTVYEYLF